MTGLESTSGRRPTLHDVAAAAQVSITTVSLVLSGRSASRGRVTDQTRERVLDAAARLGYERNQLARGLRRGRTEQVSVYTQNPLTPWSRALTADVSAVATTHGYSAIAVLGEEWTQHLLRGISDGAVIDPGWDAVPEIDVLHDRLDRGFALVVLSNHLDPDGFDVVQATDASACASAMSHLIETGHRRIACLRQSPPQPARAGTRFRAYREALLHHGITASPSLVRDFYGSRERAYSASLDLLRSRKRPDAIFATADSAAISALWAAHRLGIAVPDELAIIGVGNSAEGSLTDPPLTSAGPVCMDFTAVAEMLFDRLEGHVEPPGRILVQDWSLIHRGTA